MKNPQTTIAPTFLTHIIFAIGGVAYLVSILKALCDPIMLCQSSVPDKRLV